MSCLNATEVNCDEVYYAYVPAMYIYVLIVIIVFGLSGNFLSLIVFEAQRRGKGPATLGLLTCLAIADSLYLISNIFSRLLPTLSKYVYLGEQLLWSMEIRPYCTVWASIFQAFSAFMVFFVTLHRYLIIAKPLQANIWMSKKKISVIVIGIFLFSIAFNIPRFFELHISWECNECLGNIHLPTQTRTELGENIYFQIIYNVIVKSVLIRMVPITSVIVLTIKLVQVSIVWILN